MKKFLIAATMLFALASCSTDDDVQEVIQSENNPDPTTVLVRRTVQTYPTGFTKTSDYIYDGVKVEKIISSDGSVVDYIYNAQGQVTEINSYAGLSLHRTDLLTYNTNGKLEKLVSVIPAANYSTRTEYTYNSNGTIEAETFTGDFMSANTHFSNSVITFNGDNMASITKTFEGYVDAHNFTYDDKNSFNKNIAAREVIALVHENGGSSNKLSYVYSSQNGGDNFEHENSAYVYTYNAGNYPVTSTETTSDDDVITTQYFYE